MYLGLLADLVQVMAFTLPESVPVELAAVENIEGLVFSTFSIPNQWIQRPKPPNRRISTPHDQGLQI